MQAAALAQKQQSRGPKLEKRRGSAWTQPTLEKEGGPPQACRSAAIGTTARFAAFAQRGFYGQK
jgi:hypothetical protein